VGWSSSLECGLLPDFTRHNSGWYVSLFSLEYLFGFYVRKLCN
jgi:hypothetical protein